MLQQTVAQFRSARQGLNESQLENPEHIIGYKAVSGQNEHIGSIKDYVFDNEGHLRYLAVDTGFWIFGKTVLVPAGLIEVNDAAREVVIRSLTKDLVQRMPAYDSVEGFDRPQEDTLMQQYYPDQPVKREETGHLRYEDYREGFKTPDRLQLLEERLQIDKQNTKVGDVTIRKQVETQQEQIDVPLTREKLVIETRPVDSTVANEQVCERTIGDTAGELGASQSITIPLYEEQVDVSKRTVVAQEVVIRKKQETYTEHVQAETRRETLDVPGAASSNLNVERRTTTSTNPGAASTSATSSGSATTPGINRTDNPLDPAI